MRYDPFDASVAYAYVHKRWVKCTSQYRDVLAGRSEKELQIATQELRRSRSNLRARQSLTAKDLALFFEQARDHEKLAEQQRKDTALKRLQANREREGQSPPAPAADQTVQLPHPSGDPSIHPAAPPPAEAPLEDYGDL